MDFEKHPANLGDMTKSEHDILRDQPFWTFLPTQQRVPFVLNSPHSGRIYPKGFLESSRLNAHTIRSSEDFLVDELIADTRSLDLVSMGANFPRAFLDVNREPYELDSSMFNGELPAFVNTNSMRVASGLGTIARIVAEGEEIYNRRLEVAEAMNRVEQFYKPYHAMLRHLLAQTHVRFGCAVLIDCHSMPSSYPIQNNAERPDFILGNRFGSSCSNAIVHAARELLEGMGFHVELNKPYAGGFITEHYGRPQNGLHAMQIEINRGLYMNEVTLTPNRQFPVIKQCLTELFAGLTHIKTNTLYGSIPLAAE